VTSLPAQFRDFPNPIVRFRPVDTNQEDITMKNIQPENIFKVNASKSREETPRAIITGRRKLNIESIFKPRLVTVKKEILPDTRDQHQTDLKTLERRNQAVPHTETESPTMFQHFFEKPFVDNSALPTEERQNVESNNRQFNAGQFHQDNVRQLHEQQFGVNTNNRQLDNGQFGESSRQSAVQSFSLINNQITGDNNVGINNTQFQKGRFSLNNNINNIQSNGRLFSESNIHSNRQSFGQSNNIQSSRHQFGRNNIGSVGENTNQNDDTKFAIQTFNKRRKGQFLFREQGLDNERDSNSAKINQEIDRQSLFHELGQNNNLFGRNNIIQPQVTQSLTVNKPPDIGISDPQNSFFDNSFQNFLSFPSLEIPTQKQSDSRFEGHPAFNINMEDGSYSIFTVLE